MPVWPKSVYTFGVSLLTAATEWKLRQKRGASAQQERTWRSLVGRLGTTRFWREAGVESGMAYSKFQSQVALRSYEELSPAIERVTRGEADVLWPGRCSLFATSSGTSGRIGKLLPVTEEMLAHFRRAEFDALLAYTVRVRHAGVFRGRHLFLGGSTALTRIDPAASHEAYAGDLNGIAALNRPAWVERHLYEPGPAIAQLGDWDAKIEAIISRTNTRDISLLSGVPQWCLQLAQALLQKKVGGKDLPATLQARWPNLECLVHSGAPIAPFQDELRATLGPTVTFHEIYPTTGGFLAVQDGSAHAGLRLMTDAGLFFEFLPMSDFDVSRLGHLGPKAVPLAGVKVGVDYAIVLTTPAGLARYLSGDVVRFLSTAPPRFVPVGRTSLRLSAFGEYVSEKDATDALVLVCQKHRWIITNFHVAPLRVGSLTGQVRGHHEWWIELKAGTVATPTGPQIASELDTELQRSNEDYAARRRSARLDAPVVRLVMPGVFEHWLRFHQRWGGQHRMPRCRSDRLIADELAQVTNFARDQ